MRTTIEIIGVYPVKAPEPVHLIEVQIRGSEGVVDAAKFTQEMPGQPEDNWQVAWDEKILDTAGEMIIADGFSERRNPMLWIGDIRMAFFFHYLNFSLPLMTPFGEVALPPETKKPRRLSSMKYETP